MSEDTAWLAPVLASGTFRSRYALGAVLGEGAMGLVYAATHLALDRPVAIKFVRPGLLDPVALSRFTREARLAARIVHPNVVVVFDSGQEGEIPYLVPYLVMERVEGPSLRTRLAAGALSLAEALRVASEAARGLAAAHDAGIIHRDVKPENVLLTSSGGVKLADFGIARPISDAPTLTTSGLILGSPAYMSPEQVANRELSASTDQYSLGIVLYEMLCGRPPFSGSTGEILAQHLRDAPPRDLIYRERVPPQAGEVLDRLLDKEPAGRFPSMHAAADALGAAVTQVPAGAATGPIVAPGITTSGRAATLALPRTATGDTPALIGVPTARIQPYRVRRGRVAFALVCALLGAGGLYTRLAHPRVPPPALPSTPAPASEFAAGTVIGNRRSHIYHVIGEDHSTLPHPENRVFFKDIAAAEAEGYRRSKF